MALNAYISQVQTLLHDPFTQFYPTATLTGFINEARQQLALEGECIRGLGTLDTTANLQLYLNSAVTPPSSPSGISSLIVPRSITYKGVPLENRNWDWFNFYWLGILQPSAGAPAAWSPFIIGGDGNFFVGPVPNGVFELVIDGAWSPEALADDTTPEAIPYPWTDAVQWYTVFLALTDGQRHEDAAKAYNTYEEFMQRARGIVTPLRAEETYPGGLAARRSPGQAPPTVPGPVPRNSQQG